ncbi:MAG TPA: ABC-type transport auxiliary lipoprotein family protein [Verrucomicrobiae bacterium]|nr:ABC-type transport auxiliary lipoprotein family protein [Verrucomicrobiae bacterium]
MRRTLLAAAILFLAGFYASCGAARPVKYYTLSLPPAPANNASSQFPITLLVGRLDASLLYRTDRLAYGSGPVELGLYEDHRWASTPVDMVQDLLISSLRSTGDFRSVSRLGSAVRGDYIIRGHLYSLYEVDKPELVGRFSVQIELYDPKSRSVLWSGTYTHDEPAKGNTVADVIEALNLNVSQGLHELAAQLGQYFAAHPPAPPSQPSN